MTGVHTIAGGIVLVIGGSMAQAIGGIHIINTVFINIGFLIIGVGVGVALVEISIPCIDYMVKYRKTPTNHDTNQTKPTHKDK